MPANYATALHNYFQGRNEINRLSYAEAPSGLPHAPTWTVQCKIDGEVKGAGTGAKKTDAREAAARAAFLHLNPYGDAVDRQ